MTTTMPAAVFEGPGRLVLREVPEPEISAPDHVKVRVEAAGICGTDVHIVAVPPGYQATPGTILGHEFAGRVVAVGDAVRHLKIGDRVAVNPNDYCGCCPSCRQNRPNLCRQIVAIGIDAHGAFAPFWVGAAKLAFRIDEHVPPAHAAFAEMLADTLNGTHKAALHPGETAAVIGLGPIGHLFAQVLRASGAKRIVLVDHGAARSQVARDLGWEFVICASGENAVQQVCDLTDGGPDVVVDAAGSALADAIAMARPGGRVIVFGVNTRAQTVFPQAFITTKELHITGAWLANGTFPDAVRFLEAGTLMIEPLITCRLPLEKVHEGLDLLRQRRALKVIIEP